MIPINNKIDTFWNQKFVVIDVETTGHCPEKNRITEIAYVLIEGGEIIKEFSSLINPHQFIPQFISNMTGISNEMAFKAPEASSVLKNIAEMLDDKDVIFVAHNVNFDLKFVQQSLKREGYHFPSIPNLCTYKLAKNLLPTEQKKNVGALAQYFDIKIKQRHRALGDAKATALILIELLEILEKKHNITSIEEVLHFHDKRNNSFRKKGEIPQELIAKIDAIPNSPGIYKFFDEGNNLIYIGKSKDIKSRVKNYFSTGGIKSRKELELYSCIRDVKYMDTNTELSALLLENKLIKVHQPYFNRKQKITSKYPFIKLTLSEIFPKIYITENIDNDGAEYFGPFRNVTLAENLIKIIDNNFKLIKCTNIASFKQCDNCIYNRLNQCLNPQANQNNNNYVIEVENVKNFLNGFSNSLINELENKMNKYAENLNFEEAAVLRDQIKDLKLLYEKCQLLPTSIDKNNFIFIDIENNREKTLNYYFIYNGLLKFEKTIGALAKYNFEEELESIYFNNPTEKLSQLNIEEMRIINSWLHKNKDNGHIIHIKNKSTKEIQSEIDNSIKLFEF
jgi:DNA polymerase-3 subunit epsilon